MRAKLERSMARGSQCTVRQHSSSCRVCSEQSQRSRTQPCASRRQPLLHWARCTSSAALSRLWQSSSGTPRAPTISTYPWLRGDRPLVNNQYCSLSAWESRAFLEASSEPNIALLREAGRLQISLCLIVLAHTDISTAPASPLVTWALPLYLYRRMVHVCVCVSSHRTAVLLS